MTRYRVMISGELRQRLPRSQVNPWEQEWGRGHLYSIVGGNSVALACVIRADDAQTARDVVVARFTVLAQQHAGQRVHVERVWVNRLRLGRRAVPVTFFLPGADGDGLAGALVPRRPILPPGHLRAARPIPRGYA